MNELSELQFERLEDRTLMAVNVALGAKKGILTLTGDAAGDDVDIEGTGFPTEVEVYVNGVSVGTFTGVKSIRGNLGAGDDEVHIAAVNIGGSVTLNMGAGGDEVDFDNEPGNGVNPDGDVFIGGSVTVNFGGDAEDLVNWGTDGGGITIGNNVTFAGVADVIMHGDGDSSNVDPEDITIGGSLKIVLSGQGNFTADGLEISARDLNVNSATIVNGTAAAESITVSLSNFGRRVEANLGGGDDVLDLQVVGQNRFNAAVVVDFGAGIDTLDANPADDFVVVPVFKKGPEIVV